MEEGWKGCIGCRGVSSGKLFSLPFFLLLACTTNLLHISIFSLPCDVTCLFMGLVCYASTLFPLLLLVLAFLT
jgi:hypothetical protein